MSETQPMPENTMPQTAQPSPVAQSPKSSGGKGLILIILVLLVVIAGGVGAFVVIQNNNNQKKEEEKVEEQKKDDVMEEEEQEEEEMSEEENSRESIEDLLGNITSEDDAMNELDGFLSDLFETVELPSDFPSDAPIYDEKQVYSVSENDDTFDVQMRFTDSKDTLDDIVEFYKEELESEGWDIRTNSKTSISASITAEKDDGEREIDVSITDTLGLYIFLTVSK